jgi:hypothetical protein
MWMTWNRSKHVVVYNKWNLVVFGRILTWFTSLYVCYVVNHSTRVIMEHILSSLFRLQMMKTAQTVNNKAYSYLMKWGKCVGKLSANRVQLSYNSQSCTKVTRSTHDSTHSDYMFRPEWDIVNIRNACTSSVPVLANAGPHGDPCSRPLNCTGQIKKKD